MNLSLLLVVLENDSVFKYVRAVEKIKLMAIKMAVVPLYEK